MVTLPMTLSDANHTSNLAHRFDVTTTFTRLWMTNYILLEGHVILVMAALCNRGAIIFLPCSFFMVALCNRETMYIFILWLLSFYLYGRPM